MSVAIDGIYEVLDARTRNLLELRGTGDGTAIRRRGHLVRKALLLADVAGLTAAFAVAHFIYYRGAGTLSGTAEIAAFIVSLPLWVVAARIYGLYDRDEERTEHSTADDFVGVFHLVTVGTFLLFALSRETGAFDPEFGKLLIFWAIAFPSVTLARASARSVCRRRIHYVQNTIIVGAGEVGQNIARKLLKHHEYGLNLVGFVDSDPLDRIAGLEHLTLLGTQRDLPDLVRLLDVERVIIAFSNEGHELQLELIRKLAELDVQVDIVPRLFDGLNPNVGLHPIEGIPLVSLPPTKLSRSALLAKRVLDLVVASLALLAFAPVIGAIAVAVKLTSKGPVLYRHARVGQNGASVGVLKFRTMYLEMCRGSEYGGDEAEAKFADLMADPATRAEFADTFKLKNDPRVTKLGGFLRRSSLDELPQLWNVLRGDLSLVGPRALTQEELDRYYGESTDALLAIRPGVTGYWQVNGRSELEYVDRVRLDMAYVGGWSLALDLTILARTARTVLSRARAF